MCPHVPKRVPNASQTHPKLIPNASQTHPNAPQSHPQGLSDPAIPDVPRDAALRLCHDAIKQLARRYNGTAVALPATELPPPYARGAEAAADAGGLGVGGEGDGKMPGPSAAFGVRAGAARAEETVEAVGAA